MSVTYQWGEGAAGTGGNSRAISTIVGNVITTTSAFGGAALAVGRAVEITGNSNALNNCLYTVIAVAGAAYTVRPTPIAGGTLGTLRTRTAANTIALTSPTINSITALPNGAAAIEVTAATFITDGVKAGDRISVSGAAAANNGAWYVIAVPSQTVLIVVAPDGGTGMITAGAAGSIAARRGMLTVNYLTQAVLSFNDIVDTATPAPGPGGSFLGPGAIGNFIRRERVGGGNTSPITDRTCFDLYGITQIDVNNLALGAPSSWDMANEIVINRAVVLPATSSSFCRITQSGGSWGVGNELTFTVGVQPGNRYSAQDGSALIGVVIQMTQSNLANFYGSYVDNVAINNSVDLGSGNASACLIRPTLIPASGVVEEVNCYGHFALVCLGAGDQNNILIASQVSTAAFTTTATVGGLLLSDVLPNVLALSLGGLVTIQNPRIDVDLFETYGGIGSSGTFSKVYSFDPIVVHFDPAVSADVYIVEGRRFIITEINLQTEEEIEVYSGITDSGGFLTPTCPDLRVSQLTAPNTNVFFNHRIEQSGGGLHESTRTIHLRSKVTNTLSAFDDFSLWTRRTP